MKTTSILLVCLIFFNDLLFLEPVLARAGSGRSHRRAANSQTPIKPSQIHIDKPISNAVNSWLKRHELRNSQVAVEVMDFSTGNVVCSVQGEKRFTPASTAKVFSTACAFETLGGNYRYSTAIAGSADIKDGKVKGDIYLMPSQDPTLTYGDLMRLFGELAGKGVKNVEGNLKLSPIANGGDHFVPSFLNEDWGQEWMPVSSDLVVDSNIFGGGNLPNSAKLLEIDASQELNSHSKSIMRQDLYPGWMVYDDRTNTARAYRGYPVASGKGPLVVGNPTVFNLALARSAAKNAGIKFGNKKYETGVSMNILVEHKSEPLSKIIQRCLHQSDNLYAQQLLRSVAVSAESKGNDHPTLEEKGLARMKGWLASFGVTLYEVVLKDGCGLSRKDCVTPHSLNMVLRHMLSKYGEGGYVSLLKGGEVKHGQKSGSWKFKTGAMDSVRCITGVLKNSGGQSLLVTIMVNGHAPGVGDVRTSIGALVSTLAGTQMQAPEETKSQAKQQAAP
ncbi:MAG: D-alanyl-D-alanine carboxypeptidase/D-alanyl-D-alanine-endopeptidase [Cyanobacteria bacterium PR.3.49]|nr:D-alanyl-D-alanine carboxypeptidase/D-alanyl-D-alanine-endopeptidase [Cyanobacteria bacterium PR.3.49]